MDKRRELRFEVNQSVAIILFGDPDIRLIARIRNLSGRGIGLELEGPVAAGTALKIELEDTLLLGEVIYCRPDEASFYVGVQLEHALNGLGELSRMVNAFAGTESSCSQHAHAVVKRDHQSQQQTH